MQLIVEWLKLVLEIASVGAVVTGVLVGTAMAIGSRLPAPVPPDHPQHIADFRLVVSRYLLLSLELLLAADIIATVINPTWNEIARLAAIAGIRTFLSYFLERDIEKAETESKKERAESPSR